MFRALGLLLTATVLLTSCAKSEDEGDVGVALFMFNWNSVALECEESLGPSGIDWVLISPPQEHVLGEQWWVHYQPVSYKLESRLGTEAEFRSMVEKCNQAGVKVIADAVINHMSGRDSGVGWAGSEYSRFNYPNLYSENDFHRCELTPSGQIESYQDRAQVQTCSLLGLADLKTEDERVQSVILDYLKSLLSLGVSGFRIDAAKHIPAEDLEAIIAKLPQETIIFHEVIRGGGEPITPEEYTASGLVWEFSYADQLTESLSRRKAPELMLSEDLSGFAPSDRAISFVANHDTERNGRTLSPSSNPELFQLASYYLLAGDYGTPMLFSGYYFLDFNQGPITDGAGLVLEASCVRDPEIGSRSPGEYLCQHREESILAMVSWRNQTRGLETTDYFVQGKLTGWGKGDLGFFLLNADNDPRTASVQTSLKPGSYCNLLEPNTCEGNPLMVGEGGMLEVRVEGYSAVAILAN